MSFQLKNSKFGYFFLASQPIEHVFSHTKLKLQNNNKYRRDSNFTNNFTQTVLKPNEI